MHFDVSVNRRFRVVVLHHDHVRRGQDTSPVDASDALDQRIPGCGLGDQGGGVEIDPDLNGLGGDQHRRPRFLLAIRTEELSHLGGYRLAIHRAGAAHQQQHLGAGGQALRPQ